MMGGSPPGVVALGSGAVAVMAVLVSMAACQSVETTTTVQLSCVDGGQSDYFTPVEDPKKHQLGLDKAWFVVESSVDANTTVCMQSAVCYNCSLVKVLSLKGQEEQVLAVDTRFPVKVRVIHQESSVETVIICEHVISMDEHGNYSLYINPKKFSGTNCNFVDEYLPNDNNIPIYVAIAILGGLAVLYFFGRFLYARGCCGLQHNQSERLVNSDLGVPSGEISGSDPSVDQRLIPPPPQRKRLRSLDTFRGLSLIIMVFVNYRGGQYWFFHHSAWDGLTVADLVFPWFVFIMGTSIAVAFHSQFRRGILRKKLLLKVLRRSLILFALGIMTTNRARGSRDVQLSTLRVPGVLQRLGFTYFIVALMEVIFGKAVDRSQYSNRWWICVCDIVLFWQEWVWIAMLLAIHLCITFLLPVPGCPTGYMGPGGLHDNSSYVNCTGGAAGYIDRWLFGTAHLYQHPTCKIPYMTNVPYDPEGILGTVNSIFLCFLGLQAGKILLLHDDWKRRSKRWLLWCLLTGVVAGVLCNFQQYGGWIPINKNLWSLSFVLAMASMAFFLLTLCYIIIDILQVWSGAPFFYPGMNSILIYLGHEILSPYFPVQFSVPQTHAAQLAMSLWGAVLWTIVAALLYWRKITVAI